MARRRKSEGGASFDSLLDTMTNVVAILVIMLVVTLLGVRDAVRRIKWQMPDISEEQLREFREMSELKEQELSDVLADIEETERVLAELKRIQEEIALLEKNKEKPEENLKQLAKTVQDLKKQKESLDNELNKDQKTLAQLRQELARLPESNPEANKVIRMPNPRSAPKGSTPVWFMCRYNRVTVFEQEELLEEGLKRIESARYQLSARERGKVIKKDPEGRNKDLLRQAASWVLEPERLVDYFKQNDLGNSDFRLSFELHPTLKKERLFASMRKDGGEPMQRLETTVSRFEAAVRNIDKDKHYARFIVYPDSFEIYIRAREIIEKHDVPAGWLIQTADNWQIAWDFGIHVKGEKTPKPQPASKKPTKPSKPVVPEAILD